MLKHLCRTAGIGLLVAAPLASVRAQTVDQSALNVTYLFAPAYNWFGQTFRPAANVSAGAGFNLYGYSGSILGQLKVELWTDAPSNVGATMLASGTTGYSIGDSQFGLVNVFWAPVAVTPNTQYFLAMSASNGAQGTPYATASAPAGAYSGGGAYYNSTTNKLNPYSDLSNSYDVTFQEFSEGPVVATPEPAGLLLMGSGLAGLAGVARRRRQTI